jgi:hypothetical protein
MAPPAANPHSRHSWGVRGRPRPYVGSGLN